jgi:two-component system, OmpR family, phosphate regulon sensor histidine kinase PhoR
MTSSRPPDASLYELAVNLAQPAQPLQLSPTTFKSTVGLFLDFLIEQKLPTSIWLKLPRGDVWQAEVQRFCQDATAPYTITSLQTYQKPTEPHPSIDLDADLDQLILQAAALPADETQIESSQAQKEPGWQTSPAQVAEPEVNLDDFMLEESPAEFSSAEGSRVRFLPLAADSQLKREYFVLVVSPGFYGMVLTHRPRSMRGEANLLADDPLDRKHPLLGLCSFEQSVIQAVLEEGINAAICFGQPDQLSSQDLTDYLVSWEKLQQQYSLEGANPALMGRLLTQQIQRQEELWRSSTAQRRQVESLPLLQQEKETLLAALQAKDEFIKTMGLELRTPLSTMKTALSLLNSSSLKQPQRQRYMDMLSQECDRQSSLITGALDLVQLESTVEQMSMEALRLSDIVPGVVSTYQPLALEKGVMLGYVVPEDLPPVSCLMPWLKQIVINLLHNSIKFTPKGGQVWVRARQQGDSIQLEFRDTGIGIASNDLPRIFERFYRVRSTTDDSTGTGLGLSIVQQLLLRTGGSISVKSKVGEGTVFTVLLPIYLSA